MPDSDPSSYLRQDGEYGTEFYATDHRSRSVELSRNNASSGLKRGDTVRWFLKVDGNNIVLTTEQVNAMFEAWKVMLAEVIEIMEEN